MAHRVLAIATDGIQGPEPAAELRRRGGDGLQLRVVVPAVEANAFRHVLGDTDEPRMMAEKRLAEILGNLRGQGIQAAGEVGDPDPVQAAQDALLEAPADEILIFQHEDAQARWFEKGLFERAQAGLEPPLRLVVIGEAGPAGRHVAAVEEAGAGTVDPDAGHEIGAAYLPGLTRGDLAGMVAGIVGTTPAR